MTEKVLCVDDEPNVLATSKRQLRKHFHVETVLGGDEGLELVDSQGPFAVVVADMRMPFMNGIQFLAKVKERTPDTVRIMLTGNADLQTAINAVNEGHVFRFLTKPCPREKFVSSIKTAARQYQLVTAEQELTSKTLVGSVRVLSEILSLTKPSTFMCVFNATDYAKQIASQLRLPNLWQIECSFTIDKNWMPSISGITMSATATANGPWLFIISSPSVPLCAVSIWNCLDRRFLYVESISGSGSTQSTFLTFVVSVKLLFLMARFDQPVSVSSRLNSLWMKSRSDD